MGLANALTLAGAAGVPGLAPIGAAFGFLGANNQKKSEQSEQATNAFDQGRQSMLDMKNGLEMDDSDRKLVADSIDREKAGYGEY